MNARELGMHVGEDLLQTSYLLAHYFFFVIKSLSCTSCRISCCWVCNPSDMVAVDSVACDDGTYLHRCCGPWRCCLF